MLHLSSNRPDSPAAVSQWLWDIQTVWAAAGYCFSQHEHFKDRCGQQTWDVTFTKKAKRIIRDMCFKQSRSVCTSLFDHNLRSELILNFAHRCEINSSECYRLETAHTHTDRCCSLWQIRPLFKLKVVKAALEVCTNSSSCSPQYSGIRSRSSGTGSLGQNEVRS